MNRGRYADVSHRRAEFRAGRTLSQRRIPRRRADHRPRGGGAPRLALRAALPRRVRDRPLSRRMELARGQGRRRPHAPDLQCVEVGSRRGACGPPSPRRSVVRAASRLAGRAHQPGQRAVEAAGSALPRLSPGRQLSAMGGASRDVHLLDRARRDQRERRHHRVRGGLASLGSRSARRPVPRARRLRARDARGGRTGWRGPRSGAGRGPGRRGRLPPRAHLPRLRHQPRGRAPPGAGVALHVFSCALPPDQRRNHLRPLQAGREHGDGRVFFPVLWAEDGYRSAWLDAYLDTAPAEIFERPQPGEQPS